MLRVTLVSASILLAVFGRPAYANELVPAAPATKDARKDEAKSHFLRGLTYARDDQNWDAALAEFLASRELFPTQVALRNAAVSLTHLGRDGEALQMYAELLDAFDSVMTATERAEVDAEIAELRARMGELHVDVSEEDATIVVDGETRGASPLGDGISVAPGTHWLRVKKTGFLDFEVRVSVASKQRRQIVARLEPLRSTSTTVEHPAVRKPLSSSTFPSSIPPRAHEIYLGTFAGTFWSPSFAGSAASACESSLQSENGASLPGCRTRQRPLGPLLAARFGYTPVEHLDLELTLGYFTAGERLTRSMIASGELGRSYTATDYRDETSLSAEFITLGAGFRFGTLVPIEAKLAFGVAHAEVATSNHGTFTISSSNPNSATDVYLGTATVSIPEAAAALWLPLVMPEIRTGYRILPNLTVEFALGALVLFAPGDVRTGANSLSTNGSRRTALPDVPHAYADGTTARPGILTLPTESRLGTIFALAPSLGVRFEL